MPPTPYGGGIVTFLRQPMNHVLGERRGRDNCACRPKVGDQILIFDSNGKPQRQYGGVWTIVAHNPPGKTYRCTGFMNGEPRERDIYEWACHVINY